MKTTYSFAKLYIALIAVLGLLCMAAAIAAAVLIPLLAEGGTGSDTVMSLGALFGLGFVFIVLAQMITAQIETALNTREILNALKQRPCERAEAAQQAPCRAIPPITREAATKPILRADKTGPAPRPDQAAACRLG